MSTERPIPPFAALAGSAHSWSEDFGGENGNYENRCTVCENHFIGHKRRLVCKVCATESARKWEAMSEDERQKSIARTREELAKFYAQNDKMSHCEPEAARGSHEKGSK